MDISTILALPKKILVVPFIVAMGMAPVAQATSVEELELRIGELERLLQEVKEQQSDAARMEQKEAAAMKDLKDEVASAKGFSLSDDSKLSFYGSIRPAVTYFDNNVTDLNGFVYDINNPSDPHSSTEVTDFFTRVGVKGETDIGYGLTAFARVEMEIDIGQDGDFERRLAFAGFEGAFGRLAIGRQWHPHYNTIVEVTDVYNHRSSPFGYDRQGPYRRPNLLTYSKGFDVGAGTVKLDTAVQLSENAAGVNGGNDNRPGIDAGSFGLGFSNDLLYVGVSYLERKRSGGYSRDYYGVGASISPIDNLYLAATVQSIEQSRGIGDDNGHSVDLVASYGFGNGYKVIAGFFDVDSAGRGAGVCPDVSNSGDFESCNYTGGYNLTFQRQMSDSFRIFAEWLRFEYDHAGPGQEDTVNAISTGVRYDFSLDF